MPNLFTPQKQGPRTVLITGSSSGIGLATAKAFLSAGDRVVVCCRHPQHIQEARTTLGPLANPEHVLFTVGDVRIQQDVVRIVQETVDLFGKIDILVNNAGIGLFKDLVETSEQEWDEVLSINLKGYFLFMKAVLPLMKKQGSGVVINVSSGLGVRGVEKYSAYASSKFGVIGLTQVAAEETRNEGILVYVILPGSVATNMNREMHPEQDPNTMMAPVHIAEKILELAEGRKATGFQMAVYR
ncbi:MAG TPA: SDR family oxidoreductase [Patescibacteria group bacterium]|nr:SDR family oxidoreductase [Patescibacteria group bacterium]